MSGEVLAFAHDVGFAEGDGVVGAGIGGAAIGFAIEALVLEEEHGVVAADGGAEESVGVEGVGGEDDANAGGVGEEAFAGLRVIDGSAGEIAADGDADDGGGGEGSIGAPADER